VRVGFTQTPRTRTSPPVTSAAAQRNAADEGSPGTWKGRAASRPSQPSGSTTTVPGAGTRTGAPSPASMRSV
jgi:hypothetical protein